MRGTMIDEDRMTQRLNLEPTPDAITEIHHGAIAMIMNAMDRDVPRGTLLEIVTAARNLIDVTARVSIVHNTIEHYDAVGRVGRADLETAYQGLLELTRVQATDAQRWADLLKQCPNQEDKVS